MVIFTYVSFPNAWNDKLPGILLGRKHFPSKCLLSSNSDRHLHFLCVFFCVCFVQKRSSMLNTQAHIIYTFRSAIRARLAYTIYAHTKSHTRSVCVSRKRVGSVRWCKLHSRRAALQVTTCVMFVAEVSASRKCVALVSMYGIYVSGCVVSKVNMHLGNWNRVRKVFFGIFLLLVRSYSTLMQIPHSNVNVIIIIIIIFANMPNIFLMHDFFHSPKTKIQPCLSGIFQPTSQIPWKIHHFRRKSRCRCHKRYFIYHKNQSDAHRRLHE